MDYEEASNLLIMCSSFDRFQTFLKIKDQLNDKDYWRTLADAYTGSDNLYHIKEEVKEAFLEDRSQREYLMTKQELKIYNSLPENLTIYRAWQLKNMKVVILMYHGHCQKSVLSFLLSSMEEITQLKVYRK